MENEVTNETKDEELNPHVSLPTYKVDSVNMDTAFSRTVDAAKVQVVDEASKNDEKFVSDFKNELKSATLKLAETEKVKADLEKQNVEYHSELLKTKQLLNEQRQKEDKWDNRNKNRQYHYDGVKAIMEFVGIKTPMNLILLYFLTIVLLPFFLINKLIKGTIGALVAGAQDEDRSKAAKGFLWTMVGVLFLIVIGIITLVILRWLGFIELPIFKLK